MIADPGDTFFPYNVVQVLEDFIWSIDSDITFVRRPIKKTDPNQCVAIIPARSYYRKDSQEVGRIEKTIKCYDIMVQTLITDTDQGRGLRIHSLFAKHIIELLARDGALRVGLRDLATTDARGIKETLMQYEAGEQIFHTNRQDTSFKFLSTTEFLIETQII